MQNKKGLALLELVVAVAIVLIFAAIIIWLVSVVMQKSKVVSAKAQITQLALLLESVKDDTGYYPTSLQDLTKKEAPKFQEKGWMGFYTEEIPLDPWVNAYFYYIPPTTVLPATRSKPRTTPPSVERIVFNASPGKGRLIITNYRTTANRYLAERERGCAPERIKKPPRTPDYREGS